MGTTSTTLARRRQLSNKTAGYSNLQAALRESTIVILHDNEPRAAVIEQLKQTQEMLARLLALLQASEADKFVAHLYQARKTVPASLRATEQGQQGSRASHHRKLPDRAEPRIQWRLPRMGALLRIRE